MHNPNEDPWDTSGMLAYSKQVNEELVPKLKESALTVSIAPSDGQVDVKFATELGLSIMFNKPIVVVVDPTSPLSPGLERVAQVIIRADLDTDDGRALASSQINKFIRSIKPNAKEA